MGPVGRNDDLTSSVGRFLKKNETAIGVSRATPRGSVATTSFMAGIGACGCITASKCIGHRGIA